MAAGLMCYMCRRFTSDIARHVVAAATPSMLRVIDNAHVDDAKPSIELVGNEKLDPGRL